MRLRYRLLARGTDLVFRAHAYFVAFRDDTHPEDVLWQLGRRVARELVRENPLMCAEEVDVGCRVARTYFAGAFAEGILSVFDPVAPSRSFEEGALAASEAFLLDPYLPPAVLMARYAENQTAFGDGVRWQCRREEAEAAREEALAR